MRKTGWLALCLCAALALSGCGQAAPQKAADGLDWSEDWVTVGGVLGVDTLEGMVSRENNDALAANGMYYATWSIGEPVPYVNEDGEDAQLYDAQVYLLLAGYTSAEKAEESAEEWMALAGQQYAVSDTRTEVYNGQEFTVLTYTFDSDTNPYARGISAFGTYRNYAVSVEFSCQEGFSEDISDLLDDFLEHCHYAV